MHTCSSAKYLIASARVLTWFSMTKSDIRKFVISQVYYCLPPYLIAKELGEGLIPFPYLCPYRMHTFHTGNWPLSLQKRDVWQVIGAFRSTKNSPETAEKGDKGPFWVVFSGFFDATFLEFPLMIKGLSSFCTKRSTGFGTWKGRGDRDDESTARANGGNYSRGDRGSQADCQGERS